MVIDEAATVHKQTESDWYFFRLVAYILLLTDRKELWPKVLGDNKILLTAKIFIWYLLGLKKMRYQV
jgi:hypothetical protein